MKRSILLLATILISLAPVRAVDMFLKLTDIPGESTNIDHKDEIDVFSYSLGISNATTAITGPGGAAKPKFEDITITKRVDKSSPLLMLNCAKGQPITQAVLTLARAGEKSTKFMVITLDNVIVSSVSSSGSAGSDVPIETVSLNYAKIKVEYYQQKPDGSVALAGTFAFDIATNKSL
jgi:type VI secretion system secreted protein Hcp